MVDWWTEVGQATSAFLDQHGLLAAFVFLLIEEAGVPVPVPGDVLMLILGVHARQGFVPLWQAIAATWLGTLIGSTFLYFAARMAGRGLVYRYGRFIRLTPERLARAKTSAVAPPYPCRSIASSNYALEQSRAAWRRFRRRCCSTWSST